MTSTVTPETGVSLLDRYRTIRRQTETLAAPLSPEDTTVQSMTDASPTKYEWEVPEDGNTFKESHWIWSAHAVKNDRFAQIHAFDVEFDVAIGIYLDTGYSPGETLDFLLGIFGIDIAMDDDRIGGEKK